MDRVAIGAHYAALGNLGQDGLQGVAATLDHIARVDHLASLGAVLGGRVNVIKLQGGRVSIEPTHLTPTLRLDAVGDGAGGIC